MKLMKIILAVGAAAAICASNVLAGGSRYNPYQGYYGGWDFDNGTHAQYNPYQGYYGGYDFSDGSRAQWNPYKGYYGGWDYYPR